MKRSSFLPKCARPEVQEELAQSVEEGLEFLVCVKPGIIGHLLDDRRCPGPEGIGTGEEAGPIEIRPR